MKIQHVLKNKINPRFIHRQAEQAREQGKFKESLAFCDSALELYAQIGDDLGFAEVQATVTIIYQHLARTTNFNAYLVLAEHIAQAGVQIAEKSGVKEALAFPYFNLAKIQEKLEKKQIALQNYEKAVEAIINFPSKLHSGPAILADFQAHLATCRMENGDQTALEIVLENIQILESDTSVDANYNCKVWASGAYMRLAKVLKNNQRKEAESYLMKAKKIISGDKKLVLRWEQWQQLADDFKI